MARHHTSYQQRVHRRNSVSIPHSTDATVVFPLLQFLLPEKLFDRGFFHLIKTESRVSQEYVHEVLSEIEAVFRNKHRCVENFYLFLWTALFLWFTGLLVTAYHEVANCLVYFFGGVFVWIVLWMVTACVSKKKDKEARIVICRVVEQHNERVRDEGLRWNIPVHFPLWIELHDDFRIQEQDGLIVIQQSMPEEMTQPVQQTFPPQDHYQDQEAYNPQQGDNM